MTNKLILSTALLSTLSILAGCGSDKQAPGVNNPRNPFGNGPAAIALAKDGALVPTAGDMGSAGNYAILAKTGISNVTGSSILGDIGVSPAAGSYLTGFALTAGPGNVYSIAGAVTGNVYAANYAVPTPFNLTNAIGNMETAYNAAAGRIPADTLELASGNIGSLNLAPGLYKWSSSVTVPLDVTLTGSATDVWIFQIAGNLTLASTARITLAGGALPENIYWQVAGQVSMGTSAHFEGIILCKTAVIMQTLASMNGRIFSQTAVVLDNNSITQP